VDKEDLTNAVALNSSVYNSARILGPAIAGVVVAWIGEAGCFFINGVSYLAVIAALLFVRLPSRDKPKVQMKVTRSLIQGVQYTWNNNIIRDLLIIVALSSLLTLPYVALMPAFAADVLEVGPEGLGFLMTSIGIGAIGGALFVANIKTGRRGLWLVFGNIAGPAFLLLFCISRIFLLSLVFVILTGATNAIRQILANSLIQLNTEEAFHGRVMSIFNLLFNGMARLGALGVGSAAELIGVPLALGASAFICVIIGMATFWRMPEINNIN
jgi:MFS family permease